VDIRIPWFPCRIQKEQTWKNLIRKQAAKDSSPCRAIAKRALQISAVGFATAMNYVRCLRASDELSL
jgi:hypothetical protein